MWGNVKIVYMENKHYFPRARQACISNKSNSCKEKRLFLKSFRDSSLSFTKNTYISIYVFSKKLYVTGGFTGRGRTGRTILTSQRLLARRVPRQMSLLRGRFALSEAVPHGHGARLSRPLSEVGEGKPIIRGAR